MGCEFLLAQSIKPFYNLKWFVFWKETAEYCEATSFDGKRRPFEAED
jgi:hypothetical protein